MNQPLISIITISYNNLKGLRETVDSVNSLSHDNFEYLIIDGNSTDGTKEYLNELSSENCKWTSESDNGIYDAMNKGINHATGKWIIFMNAGDIFYSKDSIPELHESAADVLYGTAKIIYAQGFERELRPGPLEKLWKGMSFSHQAVICRTSLLKEKKFDLQYRYCADFNFLFTAFKNGLVFEKVNQVIAQVEAGGISDSKRYKATSEVFRINRQINNRFMIYPYFILKIMYGYLSSGLRKILPQSLINSMLKMKYK